MKDQINVNNKNGEDGVKTEDGEIIDDVHHKHIGYEYKNVIFKLRLMYLDLHLTNVDNRQLGQTNAINTYVRDKVLIWMIDCLILLNPLKIWQILTIKS